jgi:hypothetical protein
MWVCHLHRVLKMPEEIKGFTLPGASPMAKVSRSEQSTFPVNASTCV